MPVIAFKPIDSHLSTRLTAVVVQFKQMGLGEIVDFEIFNPIAIVHHSCAIEGCTLSMEETQTLIMEGITAKGKPMAHHLMVQNHFAALRFVISAAKKKREITPAFLQEINALVNKNTGQIRNTALGVCDDTKGDFKLGNVRADSAYFANYDKVLPMTQDLCSQLQARQTGFDSGAGNTPIADLNALSFYAHYYLVSIHPWFDGNGRSSRLLMNYIQAYYELPLSLVFADSKAEYIEALNKSRAGEHTNPFLTFMFEQQIRYLQAEIEKYNHSKKGFSFLI